MIGTKIYLNKFLWVQMEKEISSCNRHLPVGDKASIRPGGDIQIIGISKQHRRDPDPLIRFSYRSPEEAGGAMAPTGAEFFMKVSKVIKYLNNGDFFIFSSCLRESILYQLNDICLVITKPKRKILLLL